MGSFTDRLIHGWNAFMNKDPTPAYGNGAGYSSRPDRLRLSRGNDKNLVTSIYNRISIDAAQCDIQHVKLDENGRFIYEMKSCLNQCLTCSPNIDQTARSFRQDIVMSMLDEGCVAIVPTDTDINPETGSFDIESMRTGKITEWYPTKVKVLLYNEESGRKEEVILPKKAICIVENPYYAVMNEPNSTAKRLMRKLSLLDLVDEQNGAGKLDLIIQLPYIIKSDARRQQAENRRKDIEEQLASSKYGIAYTDGTEHVTQLNRSVDNQLLAQIETLSRTLYSQLGLTEEIMNGTADEKTMNNYYSRTIEPILSAIVDEMKRKFLTKTARTQKQSIEFFRDPFTLVPTSELSELADKFTRNEIMTSNEFRQIIGMKPSKDPNADSLRNKNISQSTDQVMYDVDGNVMPNGMEGMQEGTQEEMIEEEPEIDEQAEYDEQYQALEDVDKQLDALQKMLKHSDMGNNYLVHYASKYYDPVKAHEYYEEYTKKKRLKGRDSKGNEVEYSTSQLNDQGKMAYKQIKESLANERKNIVKSSSDSMKAQRKAMQEQTSSQVKAAQEQTKSKIQAEKDKTKSEIQNHVKQTYNKVKQIEDLIKKLKKHGTVGELSAQQDKIDKLREDNAKKKAELNAAFASTSAQIRQESKSNAESIRSSNKGQSEALSAQHKEVSKKASDDYKAKVKDELKKLVDSGEFKKVKKSRKKKSS